MPRVAVHGITAHYADLGADLRQSVPIVLVHAATNHGGQWDQVRAAMANAATLSPDACFRYLLPDLFNSGKTAAWPLSRMLTFDDEADIVLAVMAAIDQPVHLVGHSYGGAVALRAAVRGGATVRSLCLIEPGGCPLLAAAGRQADYDEYVSVMHAFLGALGRGDPVTAWRDFLNYYRGSRDAWDGLEANTQARILAKSDSQRQVYAAQMSNPTTLAELRALAVESLIITGGQTTAPERGVCLVLESHLPEATLHTIPGAGHPMPVSHPSEVATALLRHIKTASHTL
ncbi:MAG: alpha/beta fold hydrolase [Alphaproteobacteria bacterium]|nr:alpha/beta fold hydrolase [Alphaproteobacteria bacterium]MDP6253121.1 alpha/beta fold hydrolase [Alphaproteobacteria bacterium]MDP7055157.1 alpha/beta fold hydrolase [Alphaproteobacteria bacterium]MDP7228039.1 alpha/beta fold hydrolase [Alphaproteobacteria bacterium]MDP7459856.1 alpha/beta fold hydrolase [Alphaproteobacteria bacterium]